MTYYISLSNLRNNILYYNLKKIFPGIFLNIVLITYVKFY